MAEMERLAHDRLAKTQMVLFTESNHAANGLLSRRLPIAQEDLVGWNNCALHNGEQVLLKRHTDGSRLRQQPRFEFGTKI